jgi:FKBP-type peptidyl-prolyl cis-trans isomerase
MEAAINFMSGGIFPNMDEFVSGMQDTLRGSPRYTLDEASDLFRRAYMALVERQNVEMEREFLAENAQRPTVVVTATGLQYEVLVPGTGARPGPTDSVLVHYDGFLLDGSLFDSSRAGGAPVEFPVYGVIPGFAEGLQWMSVGSVHRIFVPSWLAYGAQGVPPHIPPNATLVFEVELLSISGS